MKRVILFLIFSALIIAVLVGLDLSWQVATPLGLIMFIVAADICFDLLKG